MLSASIFCTLLLAAALTCTVNAELMNVLAFYKTLGFEHKAIPAALDFLVRTGLENDFTVTTTDNSSEFTRDRLREYNVVVFALTTGNDILSDEEKLAFEDYIRGGGGYLGIHSASDTEYNWEFYGNLMGAYFASHPAIQEAEVVKDVNGFPVQHLNSSFVMKDEWYNFQTNPRPNVEVLLKLNEESYNTGTGSDPVDHPITWQQEFEGGRSFYTAMGHTSESYADPRFQELLLRGLLWSSQIDCSCSEGEETEQENVTCAKDAKACAPFVTVEVDSPSPSLGAGLIASISVASAIAVLIAVLHIHARVTKEHITDTLDLEDLEVAMPVSEVGKLEGKPEEITAQDTRT